MDKEQVKLLLQSYRPQDSTDAAFAEALREVSADPELAAWFEETQRFDAIVGQKLREAPVPADAKARALSAAHLHAVEQQAVPVRPGRWSIPLAAAAVVAAALFLWKSNGPLPPGRALAMQAISFSGEMPALQFVCFDAAAVADWVNTQPGAQKIGVTLPPPAQAMSMALIGSSVVDWNGKPVVMICLQNGKRMAMCYILDAADLPLPEGATETVEDHGWAARTTKNGGHVRILTGKGTAKDLDFPMPF